MKMDMMQELDSLFLLKEALSVFQCLDSLLKRIIILFMHCPNPKLLDFRKLVLFYPPCTRRYSSFERTHHFRLSSSIQVWARNFHCYHRICDCDPLGIRCERRANRNCKLLFSVSATLLLELNPPTFSYLMEKVFLGKWTTYRSPCSTYKSRMLGSCFFSIFFFCQHGCKSKVESDGPFSSRWWRWPGFSLYLTNSSILVIPANSPSLKVNEKGICGDNLLYP